MRKKCIICRNNNLKKIIDLGIQPFADTFISHSNLNKKEPVVKLVLNLCSKCGCVQTKYKTNTYKRYNLHNYSYTSSNSKFSKTHWINYAKDITESYKITKKSKVLEIGSNDGFLLKQFKFFSKCKVVGVDASKYMSKLSNKTKIKTFQMIFNNINSSKIIKKEGRFDLVIANNVFNHSDDPLNFLKGVESVLNKDGVFIFELPYWLDSVASKKFDQIYHEHVTYFNIKMILNLIKNSDFKILKIQKINYHGGSIRVALKKNLKSNISISNYIKKEKQNGLFKTNTYKKLNKFILQKKDNIHKKISLLKQKNYIIAGVGAAAKANTLINTFKLNNKHINFITDASVHKIGKYTPKSRIPIYNDNILSRYEKVYAIILSWNISKTLKLKLLKINKNTKFLSF